MRIGGLEDDTVTRDSGPSNAFARGPSSIAPELVPNGGPGRVFAPGRSSLAPNFVHAVSRRNRGAGPQGPCYWGGKTNDITALVLAVSSSAFGAGAQGSPSGRTTARGRGPAPTLVHAEGSDHVSGPSDLGFGVVPRLSHTKLAPALQPPRRSGPRRTG